MKLKNKLLAAKAARRNYFIKLGAGIVTLSLLCAFVIFYVSSQPFKNDITDETLAIAKEQATKTAPTPKIADEKIRQAYIQALTDYQNNLKPELDKIDLTEGENSQTEQLASLKDKALAAYTKADYPHALANINELTQTAQSIITDSQQKFKQALSSAQQFYNSDDYNNAKHQIAQALIFDKTSVEAKSLAAKIETLPEILPLLKKITIAKIESNTDEELELINKLLKLTPDRTSAIQRKQHLIMVIKQRNFNRYITQSYKALDKGDTKTTRQKIGLAKKIFPKHQKLADIRQRLQNIESSRRFNSHQQKAQQAIKVDDWATAKIQLALALKEQTNNTEIQRSLALVTTINTLNNNFQQQIKSPYHLSNKKRIPVLEKQLNQAKALSGKSATLDRNTTKLSQLIQKIATKKTVQVISDNQTTILVRGVGIVGKTHSKTIQLLPGKYIFEGKRKGYKSKLINILVPYDKNTVQANIQCDEPI